MATGHRKNNSKTTAIKTQFHDHSINSGINAIYDHLNSILREIKNSDISYADNESLRKSYIDLIEHNSIDIELYRAYNREMFSAYINEYGHDIDSLSKAIYYFPPV